MNGFCFMWKINWEILKNIISFFIFLGLKFINWLIIVLVIFNNWWKLVICCYDLIVNYFMNMLNCDCVIDVWDIKLLNLEICLILL